MFYSIKENKLMASHNFMLYLHLQNKWYLNQNSQVVKMYSSQKGHDEKTCESKMTTKKWLCKLMEKKLIMTIHVNLVPWLTRGHTKSCELSLFDSFAIDLPPQPFLGCHLSFTTAHIIFLQLGYFFA